MKKAILLLICLAANANAGLTTTLASKKIWSKPLTMNSDIRRDLTFWCPLGRGLGATGAGASCAATWSGGAITGTGATFLYPDSTGLYVNVPSGNPNLAPNAYVSLGAINNRALWSCGFTATGAWTAAQLNVGSSGAVIGPDGSSSTCYVMVEDGTATAVHSYIQTYTSTDAKSQVVSVYAKAGGRTWITLQVTDRLNGAVRASYNLATGATGVNAVSGSASHWWASSVSISAAGNGWYRCVLVTGTPTGTAKDVRIYLSTGDGTVTYSGDNSSSLFIWGASVADNMTFQAPGVLQTQAVAASRTGDSLTFPVAGNVANPPTTAWATYTAPGVETTSNGQVVRTGAANATYGLLIDRGHAPTGLPRGVVYTDVAQATISGSAVTAGVPVRVALAMATNDVELVQDGASKGTDTTADMPAAHTALNVGSALIGTVSGLGFAAGRFSRADMARLK